MVGGTLGTRALSPAKLVSCKKDDKKKNNVFPSSRQTAIKTRVWVVCVACTPINVNVSHNFITIHPTGVEAVRPAEQIKPDRFGIHRVRLVRRCVHLEPITVSRGNGFLNKTIKLFLTVLWIIENEVLADKLRPTIVSPFELSRLRSSRTYRRYRNVRRPLPYKLSGNEKNPIERVYVQMRHEKQSNLT